MSFAKENRHHTFNGIIFALLFALSSNYIASFAWVKNHGFSPLVIAIILGMVYGSTLRRHLPHEWTPGIQFCAKKILRFAIVLYGFRLTFQDVYQVGIHGFTLDLAIVILTMVIGIIIGVKVFKLDRDIAILISSGAAICGAAAVLATEGVLKSEPYKAAFAVITVVLFGTIAMFLYPFLQHMNFFGMNETQYGIYVGATIHEVAQVVVAGAAVSPEAGNIAVIVKMTRVMLLAPMLIVLGFYIANFSKNTQTTPEKNKIGSALKSIPWFAVMFIVVVGFNSLRLLPQSVLEIINGIDTFLLTMAMAALGIETNFVKVKQIGLKPIYFALFLFAWLIGGGYLLNQWI
ncbi:MAG: YeiH family protein [Pseudomonadota bacterium]